MKNLIFKIISLIFLFLISILVFLSVKGVETKRFNNQISQKIENINKDLKIELNKVKKHLSRMKYNKVEFKYNSNKIQ